MLDPCVRSRRGHALPPLSGGGRQGRGGGGQCKHPGARDGKDGWSLDAEGAVK